MSKISYSGPSMTYQETLEFARDLVRKNKAERDVMKRSLKGGPIEKPTRKTSSYINVNQPEVYMEDCHTGLKYYGRVTKIDSAFDPIQEVAKLTIESEIRRDDSQKTFMSSKYIGGCQIEKVIFNGPATIVIWRDGEKTVVKTSDGDKFDPKTGLALSYCKKLMKKKTYRHIFCDLGLGKFMQPVAISIMEELLGKSWKGVPANKLLDHILESNPSYQRWLEEQAKKPKKARTKKSK